MNLKKTAKALRRIVGRDNVVTSSAIQQLYAYDASLEKSLPQVVVLPETCEQVAAVVKIASAEGIPFLPRGAGTNLSGGSVPTRGGTPR